MRSSWTIQLGPKSNHWCSDKRESLTQRHTGESASGRQRQGLAWWPGSPRSPQTLGQSLQAPPWGLQGGRDPAAR